MQGGETGGDPHQEGTRTTPSGVAITKSGERNGRAGAPQAPGGDEPENTVYRSAFHGPTRYDEVSEEMKPRPTRS